MSDQGGPWGREPSEPKPAPRAARPRVGLWLLLLAELAGLVVALIVAFPQALRTQDDWAMLVYRLGFIALVSAGLLRVRGALGRHLLHIAVWVAVAAVLALGYAYRDVLAEAPRRLQFAFNPGEPVAVGEHELVVPQDDDGAFVLTARVNGQPVRFLVDTGATDTVLSPDDARRLGLAPESLRYVHEAETANGKGYGAPYVARSLEVGPLRFADFGMVVNQAPMSGSLLGLSFLNRLESFEVRQRRLILKWRDGADGTGR